MENEQKSNDPQTPVVNNQPSPAPQSMTPEAAPVAPKKTSPWVWILSGCAIVLVLTMVVIGFLGWWGYQKAKVEIQKQQPGLEQFKENLEKAGKEAEELNKKAEEIQKNIPNPEDFNYPMPSSEEAPVLE